MQLNNSVKREAVALRQLLLRYIERDEIEAYIFMVRLGRKYMIDYFAVAEDRRGQGIGAAALKNLLLSKGQPAECLLGEVEDPECAHDDDERALRRRRLAFIDRF